MKPGTAADPEADADGDRFTRPFIPLSGRGFVFGRTIELCFWKSWMSILFGG